MFVHACQCNAGPILACVVPNSGRFSGDACMHSGPPAPYSVHASSYCRPRLHFGNVYETIGCHASFPTSAGGCMLVLVPFPDGLMWRGCGEGMGDVESQTSRQVGTCR